MERNGRRKPPQGRVLRIVDSNREWDRTSQLLRQVWAPTQCVVATCGVDLAVIPIPGVGLVALRQFGKS